MKNKSRENLKRKAAKEAAILLYTGQEKEYKQAKVRAAENLGVKFLPSNREVAEALDILSQEREGTEKEKRLIEMRKKALEIMIILESFQPKLVGSVWRGTANRKSDIDILVFHDAPEKIAATLKRAGYSIKHREQRKIEKNKEKRISTHLFLDLSGFEVEIVIKPLEEQNKIEICEIYGDKITGLNINELKKILETDPLQRFLP